MRIGVLDVGSSSAHLKVVDLWPGEPPRPVTVVKRRMRLAEAINADGRIEETAVEGLVTVVGAAADAAEDVDVDEMIAFATSAIRDAGNLTPTLARVAAETGIRLGFLSDRDEARLMFLAARDWYGWSAGSMLLLDIGGGSLQIAYGDGREPMVALSLPLGAGRLTREYLPGDPPDGEDVRRLGWYVAECLEENTRELRDLPSPVWGVAMSKTFRQLARLTGARKAKAGPYVRRTVEADLLREKIPVLAKKSYERRAKLRGVSRSRAPQILAGAIVAEAAMATFGLQCLEVCPWALREGIIARRMQTVPGVAIPHDLQNLVQTPPEPPLLRPVPGIGGPGDTDCPPRTTNPW